MGLGESRGAARGEGPSGGAEPPSLRGQQLKRSWEKHPIPSASQSLVPRPGLVWPEWLSVEACDGVEGM